MLIQFITNLVTAWWQRSKHTPDVYRERLELTPFHPLPDTGYLVGGAVRDALLNRPVSDIDWLVPNPKQLAKQVADASAGSLVCLDETRNVWRVVTNLVDENSADNISTRDYVPLETALEDDLKTRDFTLNAIATDLDGVIYDPLNGRQDIANKQIRAIHMDNFCADPLRLLRGVRLACQLGFKLEPKTYKMMLEVARSQRAGQTPRPARERVASELNAILLTPLAAWGVGLLDGLKLLDLYLPELTEGRGLVQGGYHHLDVLDHSIEALRQLLLGFPDASLALRWGTLLHDVGKPSCHTHDPDTGKTHFYGHDKAGARLGKQILQRLCQPNTVVHEASELVRYHMLRLPKTDKAIRRFIHRRRHILPDLLKVMLADREAARGKQSSRAARQAYRLAVSRILAVQDLAVQDQEAPAPLLSGQEVMALLELDPGPKVGEALRFLAEARAVGDVHNKDDAMRALLSYADKQGWLDDGDNSARNDSATH
ncbi:MAG: HDIG domain-containing metalloprotein [Deinococcota bacterium]